MQWAIDLVKKRAPILHVTHVVGRCAKFYSGEEGDRFISPVNDQPVTGPVIELDNEHTFALREESQQEFRVLTDPEHKFYLVAQAALGHGLRESIRLAASMQGVTRDTAIALVRSILATQINALRDE